MSVIDQSFSSSSTPIIPKGERTSEISRLLVIYFLERASYYGIRSVIYMYLIDVFEYGTGTALYIYGLFTMAVYIIAAIGGVLGDFVLGTKSAISIGLFVSGIGAIAFGTFGDQYVYYTLSIIAIGSGLVRPNILSQTAKSSFESKKGLTKAFTLSYLMINLGAAVGIGVAATIYHSYGFTFTMVIAGVAMFIAAALLITSEFNEPSKTPYRDHRLSQRSPLNILILLIPFVAVSLFWLIQELAYSDILSNISVPLTNSTRSIFGDDYQLIENFIPLIIFSILYLAFHRKFNFPFNKILGFGMVISCVSWILVFSLNLIMDDSLNYFGYAIVLILFALGELLLSPLLLAFIAWKAPSNLMGTTYSIYLFVSFCFISLAKYVKEKEGIIAVIAVFIAMVFFTVGLFFIHRIFPKENTTID
jgi:dipeptide/tripeptide permease